MSLPHSTTYTAAYFYTKTTLKYDKKFIYKQIVNYRRECECVFACLHKYVCVRRWKRLSTEEAH